MNDGGPAFPNENSPNGETQYSNGLGGLSIRDFFAAQALVECPPALSLSLNSPENIALRAYKIADAMLAEREKPHEA